MQISIIIPVYNRKDLVGYTLESVSSDRHPGVALEVIVVDDGSTDGVIDFIRNSFPHVVIYTNPSKGAAAARNFGLSKARGTYIMYLDSDDLVGPGYFLSKLDYLEKHIEADGCYGQYEFFKSDGSFDQQNVIFKHKYPMVEEAENYKRHLQCNLSGQYLPPLCLIWRKSFLKEIGGHDETLKINQDVELLVKACFARVNLKSLTDGTFVYVREHSLDSRVGSVGQSKQKWEQILELRNRFYNDLAKNQLNSEPFLRPLSEYLFNSYRKTRLTDTEIAEKFLAFSKRVFWPVTLKGSPFFAMMGKIIGPENAVKLKHTLFKKE